MSKPTFDSAIQALHTFPNNPEIQAVIQKITQLQEKSGILSERLKADESSEAHAMQENIRLSEDLRQDLQRILQNNTQNDTHDAVHLALLALAQFKPLNAEDPISFESFEEIPDEFKVVVSTGHQFDIRQLNDYQLTKPGFHPLTNLPFSERDMKHLYRASLDALPLDSNHFVTDWTKREFFELSDIPQKQALQIHDAQQALESLKQVQTPDKDRTQGDFAWLNNMMKASTALQSIQDLIPARYPLIQKEMEQVKKAFFPPVGKTFYPIETILSRKDSREAASISALLLIAEREHLPDLKQRTLEFIDYLDIKEAVYKRLKIFEQPVKDEQKARSQWDEIKQLILENEPAYISFTISVLTQIVRGIQSIMPRHRPGFFDHQAPPEAREEEPYQPMPDRQE